MCQNCEFIKKSLYKVHSGTGFITCTCGVKHVVKKEDLGTLPPPDRITGRYHKAELSWRSALPEDYDRGKVRRKKKHSPKTCPTLRGEKIVWSSGPKLFNVKENI